MKTRLPASLLVTLTLSGLLAFAAPASGSGLVPVAERTATLTLGGTECDLIGVPSAAPVGTGQCPGVRPGALVESPIGFCTFNFLYLGGDGRRYMGTAGHCILDKDGETSWGPGGGPVALDGDGNRAGEFAYAVLGGEKDFALIRLDSGVAASPQMCHFGGPTGIDTTNPSSTVVLNHYGQGLGVSLAVPARTAVAQGMPDENHVYAEGVAIFGDSGSGVQTAAGGAVGVLVTIGVHASSIGTSGVDAGNVGITRLAPQLARASAVLGTGFTLQTAPLL